MKRLLSCLNDLHNKLYIAELDFREAQIDTPFQDTFTWIFDLSIFYNWLQEGSELFWIHRKPGSGKSTLMKYIIQNKQTWELLHNWRTGSVEMIAIFFFHHRGSAVQKSAESVLRSLITQILTRYLTICRSQYESILDKFHTLQKERRKLENERQNVLRLLQGVRDELEEVPIEILELQSRLKAALVPLSTSQYKTLERSSMQREEGKSTLDAAVWTSPSNTTGLATVKGEKCTDGKPQELKTNELLEELLQNLEKQNEALP